ncbi:anti-sigma-I factor RsgI family protein [Paenibacillus sp. y28]|uniref:anti-sigma-I factor RsgI family protein n=1 Tax=Paenibacillus sp. y28 TaxID=3129110 RepID=UPI00301A651F
MNKGVVMEMTDRHIVVLTAQGSFVKVPRAGHTCRIGEEIMFARAQRRWNPLLTMSSAIAVAVIFCVVVFTTFTGGMQPDPTVVAYISMDINPSVELGIDETEHVLEVRGLNDDGIQLVETLGEDWKQKPLEEVANEVIEKAAGYLKDEGDIIISSTAVTEQTKLDDTQIGSKVKAVVEQKIQTLKPEQAKSFEVAAIATPQEVRNEAMTHGVSAGKYAVYLNAKASGQEVELEQFQSDSITHIAKASGGLNKLVDPVKPPSKEQLKELVSEEKEGKLGSGKKTGKNSSKDNDKSNSKTETKTNSNDARTVDSKKDDTKRTNVPAGSRQGDSNVKATPSPSAKPAEDKRNSQADKDNDKDRDSSKERENTKDNTKSGNRDDGKKEDSKNEDRGKDNGQKNEDPKADNNKTDGNNSKEDSGKKDQDTRNNGNTNSNGNNGGNKKNDDSDDERKKELEKKLQELRDKINNGKKDN